MHSTCSKHKVIGTSILCSYDLTTGTFTVPPGGDGLYYFSVYLRVRQNEVGRFDIEFNGEVICTTYAENLNTTSDETTTSCSGVASVSEGKNLGHRKKNRPWYCNKDKWLKNVFIS